MSTMPLVVFAEMPEGAGRNLSIEYAILGAAARVQNVTYHGDRAALIDACREAEVILTDYVPFDAQVLGALPKCRLVSVAATGWDCVDVAAAERNGIAVCSVAEYCTEEVADHTLALLLASERRLMDFHRQVTLERDWRWDRVEGLQRLRGRTLGLIGFGRIGRAVCRRASGFGLRVLACDPFIDQAIPAQHGAEAVTLDRVLAESDILSLHCNLNESSRGLLDAGAFARMQRRPLLINTSRGAVVVERDVRDALDRGLVRAAALDVLAENSPDLARHPLAGRDDVFLTPHVAFLSDSSLADLRRISAANILAFLENRPEDVFRFVVPVESAS